LGVRIAQAQNGLGRRENVESRINLDVIFPEDRMDKRSLEWAKRVREVLVDLARRVAEEYHARYERERKARRLKRAASLVPKVLVSKQGTPTIGWGETKFLYRGGRLRKVSRYLPKGAGMGYDRRKLRAKVKDDWEWEIVEWAEGWFEKIREMGAATLEYERASRRLEKLWVEAQDKAAWDFRIGDLELEFIGRWFVVRREELRPEDM